MNPAVNLPLDVEGQVTISAISFELNMPGSFTREEIVETVNDLMSIDKDNVPPYVFSIDSSGSRTGKHTAFIRSSRALEDLPSKTCCQFFSAGSKCIIDTVVCTPLSNEGLLEEARFLFSKSGIELHTNHYQDRGIFKCPEKNVFYQAVGIRGLVSIQDPRLASQAWLKGVGHLKENGFGLISLTQR